MLLVTVHSSYYPAIGVFRSGNLNHEIKTFHESQRRKDL